MCRSQCIDRQERAPASYLTFALPLSVQSVPTSRLSMSTPNSIWSHSCKACVLRSVHRWPSTANVAVLSHRSNHQPSAITVSHFFQVALRLVVFFHWENQTAWRAFNWLPQQIENQIPQGPVRDVTGQPKQVARFR